MSEVDQVPHHWALLIGINFYNTQGHLKGAVNDVELMEQYLKNDGRRVDITILKALSTEGNQSYPSGDPTSWPTTPNIIASIKKIGEQAHEGDFVYIHFSGHGTRLISGGSYGHKDTGDASLIVLSEDGSQEEELNGYFLALKLKNLVNQGLKLTLVLDCCFSGHVYRQSNLPGTIVRTPGLQPRMENCRINYSDPQYRQGSAPRFRDTGLLSEDWFINPDQYTIITACGPHERAEEIDVNGKRYGALTWYLTQSLITLHRSGIVISQKSLHNHLVAKVHAMWPKQTPMCYGRKDFCFFSDLQPDQAYQFISVEQNGEQLLLQAGLAHGIYKGDEYAVYPFYTPEHVINIAQYGSSRVKVRSVGAITAELDVVDPSINNIENGWKAKALTSLSPDKIMAGLLRPISNLSDWESAEKRSQFLEICSEPSRTRGSCLFYVETFNESYRILSSTGEPLFSFPIPEDGGVSEQALRALEHMATFKFIEGIENRNPTPRFENSFQYSLLDGSGNACNFAGTLDIKHNMILVLEFTNSSLDHPIYLTVLNLDPSWKISCLTSNDRDAGFRTILPRGNTESSTRLRWRMQVPENLKAQGFCEDIIKIIVTSRPTSFSPFLLPKITEAFNRGSNGLAELLARLNTSQRSTIQDHEYEEFAMFNIVIRTYLEG